MAPPFKEIEFDILYGEGISKEGDLLDLATQHNIIEKSGTWYTYKDERLGQGRENARNYLKEHPERISEIREEVLKKAGVNQKSVPQAQASQPAPVVADSAKQKQPLSQAAPQKPASAATASMKNKEKN